MPGKSHSVVVLCSTGEVFSGSDSDEDLDLTDTKLLSSDDEKLKEYVEMHDPDIGKCIGVMTADFTIFFLFCAFELTVL